MLTILSVYFGLGLAAVLGLAAMILLIGRALGDCPEKGPALRTGAVSVATGFIAIGLGGVTLIAPAVELAPNDLVGLFLALGGVLIALGLGFTNAVAILRGLARDAVPAKTE